MLLRTRGEAIEEFGTKEVFPFLNVSHPIACFRYKRHIRPLEAFTLPWWLHGEARAVCYYPREIARERTALGHAIPPKRDLRHIAVAGASLRDVFPS